MILRRAKCVSGPKRADSVVNKAILGQQDDFVGLLTADWVQLVSTIADFLVDVLVVIVDIDIFS